VFITVVLHRRIPYLKNLVGQVAPQALPDTYDLMVLGKVDWISFNASLMISPIWMGCGGKF